MAINEQQNGTGNSEQGIAGIIAVLQNQAKNAIVDIDTLTEVAIENIISAPSEISDSIIVRPNIEYNIQPGSFEDDTNSRIDDRGTTFNSETIGDSITQAFSSETISSSITQAFNPQNVSSAITQAFNRGTIQPIIGPIINNISQIVPNTATMRNVTRSASQNSQPLIGAARPPSIPRTNGTAPANGARPPSIPRTNTNTPANGSKNQPVLPNVDSIFKNLLFGLVPKSVIRIYASKVKYLVDQLQKVKVPEKNLAPIIEPLETFSKAVDAFSNISWTKAFFGIKAFQFFTKSFVASINKILSPETLDGLNKFSKFSEKLSKPLDEVSDSISNFASISWGKVLIGSKVFISFIKSLAKIPVELFNKTGTAVATLAEKLKNPLESLGNTLERFGKSLDEFVGPLLKGAAAIALLSASLIPLAYGLKMFADVSWESIVKGTVALGGLVLLAKVLSSATGPLLKGAAAIAILGVSLIPLAYSLKMMENVGLGTIVALAASLTVLGVAAAIFGGPQAAVFAIGAAVIAALGIAMIPLAYGLKLLSEANPETLSNLAMPLLKLGGALLLAAPGLLLGGAALIPFSAGLAAFGLASKLLNPESPEILSNLAMPLLKLGGALLLGAPGLLLGGAALIPFSAGLGALGLALKLFSSETLDSIIPALTKLPDVAWSLAKAAPALLLSALALTPFSAAVAVLGAAVRLGGEGLLEFMDKMGEFTEKLDPSKLLATAGAIVALSGAIAAFGVAQAAEGFGNLVGRFLRFGSDSPLEQMQKFAAIGEEIKMAGDGVLNLSTGISKLAGLGEEIEVLDNFPWEKLEDLAKAIEGKAIIQIITGGGAGGMEATAAAVETATGKSTTSSSPQDFSSMSNEEKAAAAGYGSWEEYKEAGWKWKGKEQTAEIEAVPSMIGAELSTTGSMMSSSPIIINNNSGGNVSNVSSSSVNSAAPIPMPIFTGSALGFV